MGITRQAGRVCFDALLCQHPRSNPGLCMYIQYIMHQKDTCEERATDWLYVVRYCMRLHFHMSVWFVCDMSKSICI